MKLMSHVQLLELSLHPEKSSKPRLPTPPEGIKNTPLLIKDIAEQAEMALCNLFNLLRNLVSSTDKRQYAHQLLIISFVPLHLLAPEIRQDTISGSDQWSLNRSEESPVQFHMVQLKWWNFC